MNNLPTLTRSSLKIESLPMGLQIMFDNDLYDKCVHVAKVLAGSKGFVPKHLEGKDHACFAVVIRSLTWRLDPFSVAASTYQTPGGTVGYEGKLIQAVLQNSGHFEEAIKFEHYGGWENIEGKFEKKKSSNDKDYHVPAWKTEDETGVGVEVIGHVKGEAEPRRFRFDLNTAYPRNSTLWALRPKHQICYTAVRAFANLCAPEILMGISFDFEDPDAGMVDITPDVKPSRGTSAPLPEDIRTLGREDHANGRAFRRPPDNLNAEQLAHWREGWQAANRDYHEGNQVLEAEPAETKQIDGEAASEKNSKPDGKTKPAAKKDVKKQESKVDGKQTPKTADKADPKSTDKAGADKPAAGGDGDVASDLFEKESPDEAVKRLLDLVENAEDMASLNAILDDHDAVYKALPTEQYKEFEDAYTTKHIKFSGT